jgi:hypothetical protein
MTEKILIPTDLRVNSLNTLKGILENSGDSKTDILLIHPEFLSSSITELLFHSPQRRIHELKRSAFNEGLNILKNRFEEKMRFCRLELYHGHTPSSFNNLILARGITRIAIPASYEFCWGRKNFDLLPLIEKSGVAITRIDWKNHLPVDNDEIEQLLSSTILPPKAE